VKLTHRLLSVGANASSETWWGGRVGSPGHARLGGTGAVLSLCAILGLPTVFGSTGTFAGVTYLTGLGLIVACLWMGSARCSGSARTGWQFIALAATCWFVGDLLQRVLEALDYPPDTAGPPDVLWLGSYPLIVAGVGAMFRGRQLDAGVRHEVRLDVLVVTVAGALAAWKLMIAPELSGGTLTLNAALAVLYPLGDVALLATALTLLIAPGRRSVAGLLLIVCLGSTLLIDAAFAALPKIAPSFDAGALDGLLLVVNGLLAAAVLHPSAGDVAMPSHDSVANAHMHRWRVLLLGAALVAVSIASAFPGSKSSILDRVLMLSAVLATSLAIVARFYGVVRKREEAEQLLAHQAQYDHLTGLANRSLLLKRLRRLLGTMGAEAPAEPLLLYLDLDGFKAVNDAWGHAAGDHVLTTVGARLSAITRAGDTVSRIGGDEFVVLCADVPAEHAEALGEKICTEVARPIELLNEETVSVGVSVGMLRVTPGLVAHHGQLDAEKLLDAADAAMYDAKVGGGGVRTI